MSVHNKGTFENKKGLFVDIRPNGDPVKAMENAIKTLNRKVKLEGIIKDLRAKEFYEKPSIVNRRRKAEAKLRNKKNKSKIEI